MFDNAFIRTKNKIPIIEFLQNNGYKTEKIAGNVISIQKGGEFPVYVNIDGNVLFFEVDLGNISEIACEELYFKLLSLNTEILPVSVGIDTTETHDPRLVLVESREIDNLDENEILSVFDAFELAIDKVEGILAVYLK
jgi:hypothetical protein